MTTRKIIFIKNKLILKKNIIEWNLSLGIHVVFIGLILYDNETV